MLVYVINKHKKPLMPCKPRTARKLLKQGKANVVKRTPYVELTFGYITKNTRIKNNLPKSHRIDALCITGNPLVEKLNNWYYIKKVRCHNRQIHKANITKGGKKKLNQAPYIVKGYRLFDKVKYDNIECFIFGRRSSGYFDLRKLDGTTIHKSANYKKLDIISKRKNLIIERRCDSSTTLKG